MMCTVNHNKALCYNNFYKAVNLMITRIKNPQIKKIIEQIATSIILHPHLNFLMKYLQVTKID